MSLCAGKVCCELPFTEEGLWVNTHKMYRRVAIYCLVGPCLVAGLIRWSWPPDISPLPVYIWLAGVLGYTAIAALINEYNYRRRRTSAQAHLYGMGVALYLCHLLGITTLVHLTRGVTSPFALLYVLMAMVSNFTIPMKRMAPLLSLSVLLHGGLLWLEYSGRLPPFPSTFLRLDEGLSPGTVYVVVFGIMTLLTSTAMYISWYQRWATDSQLAQLTEAKVDLERLVEKRTRDLSATLAELRRTYESLEQEKQRQERFFTHVSHQFRTPIHVINNFLSNFNEGVYGEITSKQSQALDHISICSHNLASLINNLLDMSKIQSGKMECHAERCAIRPILERSVAVMQPLAQTRGVSLGLEMEVEVPDRVVTDTVKLDAILTNLIQNAIKVSKGRPVKVKVPRPGDDGQLIIEVTDEGKGIPAEHQEKIFGAFEQLGSSSEFRGSGLGLFISRSFARMMEGDLRVRSEPGRGATFELRVPMDGGLRPAGKSEPRGAP